MSKNKQPGINKQPEAVYYNHFGSKFSAHIGCLLINAMEKPPHLYSILSIYVMSLTIGGSSKF